MSAIRFRKWSLRATRSGSGFKVQGAGFWFGFKVQGSGFRTRAPNPER